MPESQVPASPVASLYAGPTPFDCTWSTGGSDAAWIHVSGEVDLVSAPQLRRTLREAQAHARLLLLDLRAVSFMDSSGIHVILATAADARDAGGRLTLVRGPAQVDRLLTLTGVDRHLPIIDFDRDRFVETGALAIRGGSESSCQ